MIQRRDVTAPAAAKHEAEICLAARMRQPTVIQIKVADLQ